MDTSVVLPLAAALLAGLVIGGIPLLTVLNGGSALKAALRRSASDHRALPDPDELEPNALALLAGGPVRVGETAVMDAFLHGRIRQQSAGDFFTLVGPSRPYTHEKDSVRRELVRVFRKRVGVSALEMLRRVVTGQGVQKLRKELAKADLVVDSPQLRQALRRRESVPRTIRWRRAVSLLVAAGSAAVFFLVEPSTIALGLLVGGLAASAALVVAQVVMKATGGASLSPNTPAGNAVLELARQRYGAAGTGSTGTDSGGTDSISTGSGGTNSTVASPTAVHPADGMTRDQAVRRTAVTGFRALRASASRQQGGRTPSVQGSSSARQDSAAVTAPTSGSGGTNGAGGAGDTGSDSVDLETLCSFADLCQGSGASGGRSGGDGSGDDGWGGDFGHHGDGGGWGGGSGSGGGWGGGDGGSGGGDGGGGGGGGGGD